MEATCYYCYLLACHTHVIQLAQVISSSCEGQQYVNGWALYCCDLFYACKKNILTQEYAHGVRLDLRINICITPFSLELTCPIKLAPSPNDPPPPGLFRPDCLIGRWFIFWQAVYFDLFHNFIISFCHRAVSIEYRKPKPKKLHDYFWNSFENLSISKTKCKQVTIYYYYYYSHHKGHLQRCQNKHYGAWRHGSAALWE